MRGRKVEIREGLYTWRELSQEFGERFGKALGWRVELTRAAPVTVCWRGLSGQLEQMVVVPYLRSRDRETAGMPWIPRVTVNCHRVLVPGAMLRRLRAEGYAAGDHGPGRMELSVLAEELFDLGVALSEHEG